MDNRVIQQNFNVPEGTNVFTRLHIPKYLTEMEHVRIFTDGLMTIALDPDLSGTDIRVLLGCIGNMEYENFLDKPQGELAKAFEMKQQNVSRSLKKLVERDYIRIVGKVGRQNIYRVNPSIAFKSRAKNLNALIQEWEGEEIEAS